MKFIHIGIGGFGAHWRKLLKETDTVEVVGLVDVNDQVLKQACENDGYTPDICFHSLEDALKAVQAEAAVISTPPVFHRKDGVAAMEAGLDVISEKPMADSMDACRAIVSAVLATGRTYVVSQNYRYSPPMQTVADLMRSGRLGDIGQAEISFYKGVDFGGGFRHEMKFPLIIDMAIHHFDLIRFVSGFDALRVSGSSWNPPWSNYRGDCSSTALFEMSNGARILYNASWCSKGNYCDWNGNWHIECEKGTLTYGNGEIKVFDVPDLYTAEGTETVELTSPELTQQAYILDEFIRCVRESGQPATRAVDNIRSIAMVFAAVEAMNTGSRVPVLDDSIRHLVEEG